MPALVRLDGPGAIRVENPWRSGSGEVRDGFPVAEDGEPGQPLAAMGVVPREIVTPLDDETPTPLQGGRLP